MKAPRLTAGLLGTFVVSVGLSNMPLEEHTIMTGKAKADEIGRGAHAPSLPPPRDPSLAVAEEYELARRKGTAESLELFIARHGDDPLATKARADLRRLTR